MFNIIFHLALWQLKDGAGLNTAGQHKMLAPLDKDLFLSTEESGPSFNLAGIF